MTTQQQFLASRVILDWAEGERESIRSLVISAYDHKIDGYVPDVDVLIYPETVEAGIYLIGQMIKPVYDDVGGIAKVTGTVEFLGHRIEVGMHLIMADEEKPKPSIMKRTRQMYAGHVKTGA